MVEIYNPQINKDNGGYELLIATDFSNDATNAPNYGYALAKELHTHILLCNVVIIPAEVPQVGFVVWPMEESNVLLRDGTRELKHLKEHLENSDNKEDFKPDISCIEETGIIVIKLAIFCVWLNEIHQSNCDVYKP